MAAGARNWLGPRLDPADLRHDGNAFTALRWLLASAVMYSHGYDLTLPQVWTDPTVAILSFPVSSLAVYLFFTLSGFLVSGSLIKRGLGSFSLARALRLVPGLWVMLLVTTFGLWAVFTPLPLLDYVRHPETLAYLFRNALLIGGAYTLPGVYPDNIMPGVVNGSLWTIPQEVRCYIVLGVLGSVGLLLSRRLFTALFVAGAIVHLLVPIEIVHVLGNPRRLAFSFFLGVLAYLWRDRLRLSWPVALAAVAAALVIPAGPLDGLLKSTALQAAFGYLLLLAAFRVPGSWKRASAALPDYSYGIYIYAFPVQQLAIAWGLAVTPVANALISWLMTLPLAALSWHLVESPALSLKPSGRREPAIADPKSPQKVSENFTTPIQRDSSPL